MIVVGKARKNQKISKIKRWRVLRQALAGDGGFSGKKLVCCEILPHLAPQKNICVGQGWVMRPRYTLCSIVHLLIFPYVVFFATSERRRNKWFRMFFP
jgi:hypothetical protein